MGQVTEPYLEQEEKEIEEVYAGGAIGETKGKNVIKLVANRIKEEGYGLDD